MTFRSKKNGAPALLIGLLFAVTLLIGMLAAQPAHGEDTIRLRDNYPVQVKNHGHYVRSLHQHCRGR